MKSKVLVRKVTQYDLAETEAFVRDAVGLLCAPGRPFGAGQKVLIKPNLLRGAKPERCVTTHPTVVEAVCRVLKDSGAGRIDIGDSPAFGSLSYVASQAGYAPLIKKYGVRFVAFSNPVPLETADGVPHLKIAGNIFDYDRVVNLPKFKSHRQMTLTLAIKNLFGCVVGKRKPVLHCLVDNDKVKFGGMLVDIARRVDPCLTVVDGIQAMQGNGPMHGDPYPLGLLSAGRDLTALDRVLADIARVPLARVYALEAARQKNFGNYALEAIELAGADDIQSLAVEDFRLADFPIDISFNPLRLIKSMVKQVYEVGIKERLAR
ncbi:MAG: DUF362 domain-containing protein [Nitrospinae bacterium]|nr:DUF362 domain-containing protein [Nitrospinota bacterium]